MNNRNNSCHFSWIMCAVFWWKCICFVYAIVLLLLINFLISVCVLCMRCRGSLFRLCSQSVYLLHFIALFTAHSVRDSCECANPVVLRADHLLIWSGMRALRAKRSKGVSSERERERENRQLWLRLDLGINAYTFGSYGFIYVLHSSMSALSHFAYIANGGREWVHTVKWHFIRVFRLLLCALACQLA